MLKPDSEIATDSSEKPPSHSRLAASVGRRKRITPLPDSKSVAAYVDRLVLVKTWTS